MMNYLQIFQMNTFLFLNSIAKWVCTIMVFIKTIHFSSRISANFTFRRIKTLIKWLRKVLLNKMTKRIFSWISLNIYILQWKGSFLFLWLQMKLKEKLWKKRAMKFGLNKTSLIISFFITCFTTQRRNLRFN